MLLAACGTTEPSAAPSSAAPAPATAAGPVSLTDSRGTQVSLPAPATRVVALEWNVAEHAVSLGVMPVGVADVAGYGNWVTAEPLDATVADVGVRGEPSIDSIAALRPDLVLATDELPDTAITQIEAFGPVAFVNGGSSQDNIGTMVAAAGLVLALASGAGSGPTRLVLAGSAIGLALDSVTVTLLLLFRTETSGLFAWGSGSLAQYGLDADVDGAARAAGRRGSGRPGRPAGHPRPR